MTRYTINIGDDFPLGGDDGPAGDPRWPSRRRRRHGVLLRVLFFLAVAAVVFAHPLKTLFVVGLVLWLGRSPRFAEFRERARSAWRQAVAHDWQQEMRDYRDSWNVWRDRWRGRCASRRASPGERTEEHDRYRGFV
jgi:hypothetical protein